MYFFKEGSNFLHHHLADGAGNVFFYSVHDLVSKYYNCSAATYLVTMVKAIYVKPELQH